MIADELAVPRCPLGGSRGWPTRKAKVRRRRAAEVAANRARRRAARAARRTPKGRPADAWVVV